MTRVPPEFPAFPDIEAKTVVADPPWPYGDDLPGNIARGAEDHYPILPVGHIAGLGECVQAITAPNAHLWLWTTAGFMAEAHEVAEAWGFDVKTIVTWNKVNDEPSTLPHERQKGAHVRHRLGMGRYLRNTTEFLLFAAKGNKQVDGDTFATHFFAERSDHSTKPAKSYRLIEQASEGPFFEMFARSGRDGWVTWGEEAPDENTLDAEPSGEPTTLDAGAW